jgi:hypothetical protein
MAKTESIVSAHSGFLSLEHAAQYADVSVKTIKRWIERGLPKYQAGPRGKVLIRPNDIEAFLLRKEAIPQNLNKMVDDVFGELQSNRS